MSAAVTWLQSSLGVDVTGEWARHVHLNVGGVLYTTRRHTLRALREHPVFGPILAGRGHRCEDGSFLLDGDGALFRYVLDFLRHGTLVVPNPFHEWEMLLREARHYQLAALEQAVLDRFEYQRSLFARQLPHGVYVWWPAAAAATAAVVVGRAGPPSLDGASADAAPAEPLPSSSPPFPDSAAAVPAAGVVEGQRSGLVRIVPPLPGLTVNTAAGAATVTFRGSQVLQDLDQLVTVLLTAYGYTIQHWDDARGRVLLTLPGTL